MSEMSLLTVLPEEVLMDNLLPFLAPEVNDLLRFRRVCRYTKGLVDTFMSLQRNPAPRINREVSLKLRHIVIMGAMTYESYESSKDLNWSGSADLSVGGSISRMINLEETSRVGTLGWLLALPTHLRPVSRVYLDTCCMTDLWKNPKSGDFLEVYADQITSLHLKMFQLPVVRNTELVEWFGAFNNLSVLKVDQLSFLEGSQYQSLLEKRFPELPENFLRCLKCVQVERFVFPGTVQEPLMAYTLMRKYYQYYCAFLKLLVSRNESLSELAFPASIQYRTGNRGGVLENQNQIQEFLEVLTEMLNQPSGLEWIELYPFSLRGPSFEMLQRFLDFGVLARMHGVKLRNLDFSLSRCVGHFARHLGPQRFQVFRGVLEHCVVSLRNVHQLEWQADMVNLEQIVITRTSLCSMLPRALMGARRPLWSKLKVLQITVDSGVLNRAEGSLPEVSVFDLMHWFFSREREALSELKLKWTENIHMVVPMALVAPLERIWRCCPNLKVLALENWPGENNGLLAGLWENLRNLEEVYLGACKHLELRAFTGSNWSQPVFWELKRLKKLTLSHLDKMIGIGDSLLRRVIGGMKLREFHLRSNQPISQISLSGIESLLEGQFAESIEKFPLSQGKLQLEGVTEQELKDLERRFRCSQMI